MQMFIELKEESPEELMITRIVLFYAENVTDYTTQMNLNKRNFYKI